MTDLADAVRKFSALPLQDKVVKLAKEAMYFEYRSQEQKLEAIRNGLTGPSPSHIWYENYIYNLANNLLDVEPPYPLSDEPIRYTDSVMSLLKREGIPLSSTEEKMIDQNRVPLMIVTPKGAREFAALIWASDLDASRSNADPIFWAETIQYHTIIGKLLCLSGAYRKVFLGEVSFRLSEAPHRPVEVRPVSELFSFESSDFNFGNRYARVAAFGAEFQA